MAKIQKNGVETSKDTEYVLFVYQEGILHCYIKEMALMDKGIAKASVDARLEFMKDKTYPCLFDITKVKQTTKEARDYLANEGNENVLASAILVVSPMLRMMANFYITVNKPKNPTQMFTDKQAALDWLSRYNAKGK